MRDKIECAWCAGTLPLYLRYGLAGEDRDRIRRHLQVCPECRGELAGYFLLDAWGERELPPQDVPDGFTAAVMDRLPDLGAPRCPDALSSGTARRDRESGRRTIFGNYLAAAAATLILIFTNAFGLFTDLAARADRLNTGARSISTQTQRLIETRSRWFHILKRWFSGNQVTNQETSEGSKQHAQE